MTRIRTFAGARGTYSLRLAEASEARLLARHRASMFRDMGEADGAAASIIDNSSQDRLAALIQAREYYGFLAEYEGEVIAGGGVWLRPLLPRPGALQGAVEAYVLNVYTEPKHRRNGVARAIMEAILDWCRERRVARVVLHASKEGRSLYEALGFEPSNEMRIRLT
ncbi:MAG: GNAT family N-acetyltransferase [Vicinamibacteria bacterium]|nr:GNAT family N-acetyltransferase [Vicinamibacteria bacterium]